MDVKRMSHNHGPTEGRGLDCPERMEYGHPTGACIGDWARMTFTQQGIVVDGVSYTVPALREIIRERHVLAEKNRRLSDQLRRNELHLQKRTAALVRLIARKADAGAL